MRPVRTRHRSASEGTCDAGVERRPREDKGGSTDEGGSAAVTCCTGSDTPALCEQEPVGLSPGSIRWWARLCFSSARRTFAGRTSADRVSPLRGSKAFPRRQDTNSADVQQPKSLRETNLPMTFILWLILAVLSWPLALLALVAYPIVWLLLLPFRIIGISVAGVLDTLRAIVTLPGRALNAGAG